MPAIMQPTAYQAGLKMVVVGVVIAVGAIASWCYWGHHFWTALKGPTQITLADLEKLEDPRQLTSTWVKVKFDKDKAVKSSIVLEKTRAGVTRIDEQYFIFPAGERWMIACVPEDFKFEKGELSGQIWRRSFGITRQAAATIADELKDVHHGKLFPFEFDASENYANKWETCAGIIAFIAGAGVFFSCLGFGGMQRGYRPPRPEDYGLSPDRYGHLNIETPEQAEAAAQIFLRDAGLDQTID